MPNQVHDFRSDTVTKPGAGMRAAMAAAEVGDDVYGDDPTVNRVEAVVAERLGKEAGVFVPSGTMSNLLALMSHCARGEEFIAGQDAHCYKYEAGGGAVLGSIQPQPIAHQPDGALALSDIAAAIKAHDFHFARTKMLALENTIGGKVLGLDYSKAATDLAHDAGLTTHLDGARVFNAATALGVAAREVGQGFDTVSVCLSKGLGAPVGSVLTGNKALIDKARWLRKMLGGGMRQAGILAAAGLYALEHNVDRLAEDHANAKALADGLGQFDQLEVSATPTNMVFVTVAPDIAEGFGDALKAAGILVSGGYEGTAQRWVTHLDVDATSIAHVLDTTEAFFSAGR